MIESAWAEHLAVRWQLAEVAAGRTWQGFSGGKGAEFPDFVAMLSCVGGWGEQVSVSCSLDEDTEEQISVLRQHVWEGRHEGEETGAVGSACGSLWPRSGLWLPQASPTLGLSANHDPRLLSMQNAACVCNSRPLRGDTCSKVSALPGSALGALSADGIEQLSPRQISKTELSRRKRIWVQKSSSLVWDEMGLTLLSQGALLDLPQLQTLGVPSLDSCFQHEPSSQINLTVGRWVWSRYEAGGRQLTEPETSFEREQAYVWGQRMFRETEVQGVKGLRKSAWLQKFFVNTTGLQSNL